MIRFTLLLSVFISLQVSLYAQNDDLLAGVPGYEAIQWSDKLPEGLLTARSAVFVKLPDLPDGRRPDWKELATRAQKGFQQIGIDAMAWYYLDDITAGTDATATYMDYLKQRRVEYILLLTQERDGSFRTVITTFEGKEYVFNPAGQAASRFQASSPDKLMREVYKQTLREDLSRSNILINDFPEYFSASNIVRGKSFKRYNPDLKIDKMAFPLFNEFAVEMRKDAQATEFGDITLSGEDIRMQAMLQEAYPFEYGLVEYEIGEKEIRNLGYQFVFMYLKTTGKTIRQMLGMEVSEQETDYVTTVHRGDQHSVKTIPVDQPVYKFYAKHIYTGDVYIGNEWDADLTWEDAFRNYIENMRVELNVKP